MHASRRRQFADILQWFGRSRTEGLLYGPELLDSIPRARRGYFERTPEALSVGTLEYLLDIAHAELDGDPRRARELTAFVLEYADQVTGPEGSRVPLLLFRARAWKEHANALRTKGDDLRGALKSVERAVEILSQNGACRPELANVRMLQALLLQELGDVPAALRIIRESTEEFRLERDMPRYVQAKILEGVFLFESNTRTAADLWEALLSDAARLADPRELARICNNLWIAAVKLNDADLAARYYRLAAELYDEVGMDAEKPRLRWGYARALAQQGNAAASLREYEHVRAEMLAREMIGDAAVAALETVELLHTTGKTVEARALALELLATFERAGMASRVTQALRFLHDRAAEQRINARDVRVVREYFVQLQTDPELQFSPPRS